MRAVQNRDFGYIWNAFFGRETVRNEGSSGPTWRAMVEAATTDPAIAHRVEFHTRRVPDELYHSRSDPDALVNLIDDPAYADVLAVLRRQLAGEMRRSNDSLLARFEAEGGVGPIDR